ncbi:MAG: arginine--tRNA ligase [Alphaproteobacteria bacterium]|nr:arginine--tRNA ligase [Alphaproteobacteria bacterium]
MNVFHEFSDFLQTQLEAMKEEGALPADADTSRFAMDPPRDPEHGDMATNAAMVLAKIAGQKPRDIAGLIVEKLKTHEHVAQADIAGPGFVNIRMEDDFWRAQLADILSLGDAYGTSEIGRGEVVNIEFVSANPTGPLHVGHARGAVVGDVLASLLAKVGYDVTREYYINDAGHQVDLLARSLYLRYLEALGELIGDFPEDYYGADYLIAPAKTLAARDGDKWKDLDEAEWLAPVRRFAIDAMMDLIREDMALMAVRHDRFSSERELVEGGRVDAALRKLTDDGLIYEGTLASPKGKVPDDWEERPQTLFRATEFGDDTDRPLRKSDGSWTYFASDLAYHLDKAERGFANQIDVWGADHGGYIKRVAAGVKALTGGGATLDIILCQMVRLLEDGKPAKMSKRSGTFVTVRDLVETVGADIVRFIMLTRKNDAPLDFDVAKVTEQSRDNPVFYVQYAHARCRSVQRQALNEMAAALDIADQAELDKCVVKTDLAVLTDSDEIALIKRLAAWPRVVESAALAHEPHRLAFYLSDLAAGFHALWTKGKDDARLRFLVPGDKGLTLARLALVQGVATVIASGLRVMGVEPVEELRS